MQVLLATSNPGKQKEILEVLGDLPIDFLTLDQVNVQGEPEENGETFEENAIIKAKYFFEATGIPVLAEDSGILVEALEGELGIKTRRWGAGAKATDAEWLEYFLERMQREKNRTARFVSVACFYDGETLQTFRGECAGNLLQEIPCPIPHGIPLSAIFVPEGKDKSYSQMSKEEKNSISHRGWAMKEVKKFLEERM